MPPCTWMDVSQTVRAARAQYTLATCAARTASAGGSSSTAHAAWRRMLTEPSVRVSASASRCATAW
jgi:hypothetical protein